ncbi:MAG: hypothetical protein KBE65_14270 [Phycisphaerae bacterium]|nr:hypothetical protein [Phycisphaerae bacterium]
MDTSVDHDRQANRIVAQTANLSSYPSLSAYPLLLTEDELIALLRIPEVSKAGNYHHVIQNLTRMHGLPCIHICKTPLYPLEAVRQWILDKVEKERR